MVSLTSIFPAGNNRMLDPKHLRAIADVVISYRGKPSSTVQCLVDTGSDYTILPARVASSIGINVRAINRRATFRGIGGRRYKLPLFTNINFEVEGYKFTSQVVFNSSPQPIPILGRIQLLAAFDSGLDRNTWYWG